MIFMRDPTGRLVWTKLDVIDQLMLALMIVFISLLSVVVAFGTELILPGVYNPNVTQVTIATTICVPNWTDTIRPPASYTNTLKFTQMRALGLPGKSSDYEEDHFIPLALGGHPTAPGNLWPQLWDVTDPCSAHVKDVDEAALHRAVCDGKLTLDAARQQIAAKWLHCKRP